MKKCLIMLAVLIVTLIISMITERKDVEMSENAIVANSIETKSSVLKD